MLFGGLDLIPTCSFPDLASILSLNWHGYDSRHFGALKKAIFSLEECYRALTNTTSLEKEDTISGSSHVPLPRDRNPCEHQVLTSTRFKTRRSYCSLVRPTMGRGFALSLCVAIRKQFTRNVPNWILLRSCEVLKTSVDKEYQPFYERSLPVGAEKNLKTSKNNWSSFVKPTFAMYEMSTSWFGRMAHQVSCSLTLTGRVVIGEVRHPISVNKVDFWRPNDVSDGFLIKSDDIAMFKRVFLPLLGNVESFDFYQPKHPRNYILG